MVTVMVVQIMTMHGDKGDGDDDGVFTMHDNDGGASDGTDCGHA